MVIDAKIETHVLLESQGFPNSRLPVLLYRHAFSPESVPAALLEETFGRNDWVDSWRNGIYDFHHYHSTAHEVLGVFQGAAEVQLGGPGGIRLRLSAGDVLVLPAGVAHRCLDASHDFGVVGAYPAGQKWDMNYGRPQERPRADEHIARVPLPKLDPVYGITGPLLQHWQ